MSNQAIVERWTDECGKRDGDIVCETNGMPVRVYRHASVLRQRRLADQRDRQTELAAADPTRDVIPALFRFFPPFAFLPLPGSRVNGEIS
jgi:hypothetical protein